MDTEINTLGYYKSFICMYCKQAFIAIYPCQMPPYYPRCMHVLEDHAAPWLRRWKIGSGLMGDQGAECSGSIHSKIENLCP